jgi:hypothetical protein
MPNNKPNESEFKNAVNNVVADIFEFFSMKNPDVRVGTAATAEALKIQIVQLSKGDRDRATEAFRAFEKDFFGDLDRACAAVKTATAIAENLNRADRDKLIDAMLKDIRSRQ